MVAITFLLPLLSTLVSLATAVAVPLVDRQVTGPARYSGVKIRSQRSGMCLAANPGRYGVNDGTPVVLLPCDLAVLTWDLQRGSGSIILNRQRAGYDTTFALDAGSNPGDFGTLKVWTSYPGLYQQTWYYTDDNRIAITGGNQCLDEGDSGIQTYQCTTGNTNQIFTIDFGTDGTGSIPPVPMPTVGSDGTAAGPDGTLSRAATAVVTTIAGGQTTTLALGGTDIPAGTVTTRVVNTAGGGATDIPAGTGVVTTRVTTAAGGGATDIPAGTGVVTTRVTTAAGGGATDIPAGGAGGTTAA